MVIDTVQEAKVLIQLADDMAAAATTFHGQGYGQFLEAREAYKKELDNIFKEVKSLIK